MSTTKSCPSCGAATPPDARFCRRCGAPLIGGAPGNGSDVISPHSATVPLTDHGRTTDGLSEAEHRPASETTRVNQSDLEAILRSAPRETKIGESSSAAPGDTGQSTGLDAGAYSAQTDTAPNTADLSPPEEVAPRDYTTRTGAAYGATGADEELTITVARPSRPFSEPSAPLQVQPIPVVGSSPLPSGVLQPTMVGAPPGQAPPPARPRRAWPLVVAVCAALLLMAVAGVLVALRFRNRPEPVEVTSTAAPVDAAAAAKKASDDKLTEAEGLLASGDLNGAIARMREAVQLDPTSVKAHRRLAEVLSESGARREAIEEFRAVTRIDPNDFTAWRSLAFAQLGEGLYAEAAESFTRLLALTGDARQDPQDLLGYADALRQSGRGEEARAVYQKLTSVSLAEIAASARQRLDEMQTAPSPEPTRTPQTEVAQNPETPQPPGVSAAPTPAPQTAPTPAPTPPAQRAPATPEEHYTRGVSLWSSNRGAALREFRAAGSHPDAHYYLGLSYVEGRDLGSLKRAEIVAALQHFQIARRGRFSGQAQQYERQLGREFDRLRN